MMLGPILIDQLFLSLNSLQDGQNIPELIFYQFFILYQFIMNIVFPFEVHFALLIANFSFVNFSSK